MALHENIANYFKYRYLPKIFLAAELSSLAIGSYLTINSLRNIQAGETSIDTMMYLGIGAVALLSAYWHNKKWSLSTHELALKYHAFQQLKTLAYSQGKMSLNPKGLEAIENLIRTARHLSLPPLLSNHFFLDSLKSLREEGTINQQEASAALNFLEIKS